MRREKNKDVLLLAHISAPSTRADDDRSGQQAQNYLHFSSARRVQISRDVKSPQLDAYTRRASILANDRASPGNATHGDSLPESSGAASFIDDTQLAWTALESQLPTSSLGATRSAAKRRRSTAEAIPAEDAFADSESSRAEARDIDVMSGHKTKKARLDKSQQALGIGGSAVPPGSSSSARHNRPLDLDLVKILPPRNETLTSNETTSELPTSYSFSEGTSPSLKERQQLSERSASDPGPHLNALVADKAAAPKLRGQETPSDGSSTQTRSNIARRRQPATAASKKRSLPCTTPSDATLLALRSLSTSIQAPQPKTCLERFETHISETMKHLAQESAVRDCFKPVTVCRGLKALERGHWHINCSPWPLEEQVSFWKTLEDTISNERAGWGVWCSRGAPVQSNCGEHSSTETSSIGTVKVYCWGEVVEHVYLMLYVASKSRVRRLGLQWIDSEGSLVVQMPRPK